MLIISLTALSNRLWHLEMMQFNHFGVQVRNTVVWIDGVTSEETCYGIY